MISKTAEMGSTYNNGAFECVSGSETRTNRHQPQAAADSTPLYPWPLPYSSWLHSPPTLLVHSRPQQFNNLYGWTDRQTICPAYTATCSTLMAKDTLGCVEMPFHYLQDIGPLDPTVVSCTLIPFRAGLWYNETQGQNILWGPWFIPVYQGQLNVGIPSDKVFMTPPVFRIFIPELTWSLWDYFAGLSCLDIGVNSSSPTEQTSVVRGSSKLRGTVAPHWLCAGRRLSLVPLKSVKLKWVVPNVPMNATSLA